MRPLTFTELDANFNNLQLAVDTKALAGLVDVSLSALSSGNFLQYDAVSGKWVNKNLSTIFTNSSSINFITTGTTVSAKVVDSYVNTLADNRIAAQKGQPNGLPTLDANSKIPVAQLPSSVFIYRGTWDPTTNTPTLADGTGSAGDYYRVTASGTINLGSGNLTFQVGDSIIYNGTKWERSGSSEAVTSVNTLTGDVHLNTDLIPEGVTNRYFSLGAIRHAFTLNNGLSWDYNNGIGTLGGSLNQDTIISATGHTMDIVSDTEIVLVSTNADNTTYSQLYVHKDSLQLDYAAAVAASGGYPLTGLLHFNQDVSQWKLTNNTSGQSVLIGLDMTNLSLTLGAANLYFTQQSGTTNQVLAIQPDGKVFASLDVSTLVTTSNFNSAIQQPLGQIVYGTGSGITSDVGLNWFSNTLSVKGGITFNNTGSNNAVVTTSANTMGLTLAAGTVSTDAGISMWGNGSAFLGLNLQAGTNISSNINFQVGNTNKMTMLNNGAFLINTTSQIASEKLRVSGAVYVDGTYITPANGSDSSVKVGALEIQAYATNNELVSDNIYFDGSKWRLRNAGYGSMVHFYNGEVQLTAQASGSAGGDLSGSVGTYTQFKVAPNGVFALGGNIALAPGSFLGATVYGNSSGQVSIGTTSFAASEKLNVLGQIRSSIVGAAGSTSPNLLLYASSSSYYSGLSTFNDQNDVGQIFNAGSTYGLASAISPRGFGIYHTGSGGMSFVSDAGVNSVVKFFAGGSTTTNEAGRFNSQGLIVGGTAFAGTEKFRVYGGDITTENDTNAAHSLTMKNTTAGANAQVRVVLTNDVSNVMQMGLYSSTTTNYGVLNSGSGYLYTNSTRMAFGVDNLSGVIAFGVGSLAAEVARINTQGLMIGATAFTGSEKLRVAGPMVVNKVSAVSSTIADIGSQQAGTQLYVNDTTSGSIYMVNDVSGLPIIEATSNWDVNIYDYPNIVWKKSGSTITITGTLKVNGASYNAATLALPSGASNVLTITKGSVNAVFVDYVITNNTNQRVGTVMMNIINANAAPILSEQTTTDYGATTTNGITFTAGLDFGNTVAYLTINGVPDTTYTIKMIYRSI